MGLLDPYRRHLRRKLEEQEEARKERVAAGREKPKLEDDDKNLEWNYAVSKGTVKIPEPSGYTGYFDPDVVNRRVEAARKCLDLQNNSRLSDLAKPAPPMEEDGAYEQGYSDGKTGRSFYPYNKDRELYAQGYADGKGDREMSETTFRAEVVYPDDDLDDDLYVNGFERDSYGGIKTRRGAW